MNVRRLGLSAVFLVVTLGACKGGSGTPSTPTTPSASATCSPAVVTICQTPSGPSGGDSRAGIGQITVSAGGAPSCRVALNEAIPISFTIVNPKSTASWQIMTNTRQSASPSTGSAGSAGPIQATVQFTTFGGDNIQDDTVFVQTSDQLGCSFRIYGHN